MGIIPAYAGNTRKSAPSSNTCRDHPRVCGEHDRMAEKFRFFRGSSPRMRGTPGEPFDAFPCRRIIPAYAGNTRVRCRGVLGCWDHPRVCGEHLKMHRPEAAVWGSSPRMRGTPVRPVDSGSRRGIIPAYAGNTARASTCPVSPRDHPRVCGEHIIQRFVDALELGSSPRMRGTHVHDRTQVWPIGIIPAYAGNTCLQP